MTIYHTEVPARLRGRGHGGRLVTGALSQARKQGLQNRAELLVRAGSYVRFIQIR
jgi:predicted GNAT family acetyltransferase